MTIDELTAWEDQVKAELAEIRAEHKLIEQPLLDTLAEIDKQWPKREVVWRNLETGCPVSIEMVRIMGGKT